MANTKIRSLGDMIREGRLARNVRLRALAVKLGKSPSYLSDIENDRRVPAEPFLRDICRELDLNFDNAMALAGKIGDDVERELRRTPSFGLLFRKMSDLPADDREAVIKRYLRDVEAKLKR
jgi:transcriptional regulator with XRE-family HTH domain